MTDADESNLYPVAMSVLRILKPLPDNATRLRVIRAAALLLNVDLEAVGLRENER